MENENILAEAVMHAKGRNKFATKSEKHNKYNRFHAKWHLMTALVALTLNGRIDRKCGVVCRFSRKTRSASYLVEVTNLLVTFSQIRNNDKFNFIL